MRLEKAFWEESLWELQISSTTVLSAEAKMSAPVSGNIFVTDVPDQVVYAARQAAATKVGTSPQSVFTLTVEVQFLLKNFVRITALYKE